MWHVANEKGNNEVAESINNNYLENIVSPDKYKLRLKPSVSDDGDYKEITQGGCNFESKSNVSLNYIFCKKQVFKWIERGFSYDEIIDAIKRLQIVSILLRKEDGDNPQQVFESINSTGMELTAADLIRNYILMDKENDTQERFYATYWRKLEDLLPDSRNLEGFLRLYLANKQMYFTSKNKLYIEFKKYWVEQLTNHDEMSLMQDVLQFGEHYYRLYFSKNEDILGKELANYRVLESEMPAPFTMEVLELLRMGNIDVKSARDVLRLINIYLIRRYITNLDTSDITRYFPTYLRLVRGHCTKVGYADFYGTCRDILLNSTRQRTSHIPDDDEIKNYLRTANAYNLKNIRWILENIEATESNVLIKPNCLSIEHVMPQTRGTEWSEVDNVSAKEYDDYVNRIGNLTLAAKVDNSAMGNRSFVAKKETLRKSSHIKMNEYFFDKKAWGFNDIDKRTDVIIDNILQLFPLDTNNYVDDKENFDVVIIFEGKVLAHGCFYGSDKSIYVKEGSNILLNSVKPQTKAARLLRDELVKNNSILLNNGNYILNKVVKCDAPSTAAEFVLGGSRNGWDSWRRESDELKLSSIKNS